MLKIIDYPLNPDGKGITGIPFTLLTPNGNCLHNITLGKPQGEHNRGDIRLTPTTVLMRDHLLSLPGVEKITLIENWEELGREFFIWRSAALTWEELWGAIEPYFMELVSTGPKEDNLEQIIARARQRLDTPTLLVERFTDAPHCFDVHMRKTLTQRIIFELGKDDTSTEPLQTLFELVAETLGQARIWVTPSSIAVHCAKGTKYEQVEATIKKVVALVGSTLYPNQEVEIRRRDMTPSKEDDHSSHWYLIDEPI